MGEGDFDQSAEHGLVARPVCPTQEVIRVEVVRNLQGGFTKVNKPRGLDRAIQHSTVNTRAEFGKDFNKIIFLGKY